MVGGERRSYTDRMNDSVRPLILCALRDAVLAAGVALALERRGFDVVAVQRWSQARLLLDASPRLETVIATCDLSVEDDAGDDSDFLPAIRDAFPSCRLIAMCADPAHTHADLPDACVVLRIPFEADALDAAVEGAGVSEPSATRG